MASARWAGAGLVPGKYVLLGAGTATLLLKRGVTGMIVTLLVFRVCSASLRSMMEDEDDGEAYVAA